MARAYHGEFWSIICFFMGFWWNNFWRLIILYVKYLLYFQFFSRKWERLWRTMILYGQVALVIIYIPCTSISRFINSTCKWKVVTTVQKWANLWWIEKKLPSFHEIQHESYEASCFLSFFSIMFLGLKINASFDTFQHIQFLGF